MRSICVALVLATLEAHAVRADQSLSAGGVYSQILGQSGKISVGTTAMANDITIEFSALTNGVALRTKHSFHSFASKTITFSAPQDVTFSGVSASQIIFSAAQLVNGAGNLTVTLLIFKQSANITIDTEQTAVTAGTVKFSVQLDDWNYCNPCGNGNQQLVGAATDLAITLYTKATPAQSANNNATWTIVADLLIHR